MNDLEKMIVEAASLEEARNIAAEKWDLEPADVSVSVVEEEKKLFGLFGRKLTVEAQTIRPLRALRSRDLLKEILDRMDLDVSIDIDEDGARINLSGEDAGIVIGRYGETLKALEYLGNLILREELAGERVHLDSDGYRERSEESLTRLAKSAAQDALRRRRPVRLDPMTSWERRIIHLALRDEEDIETRSMGQEPFRKVVVWPSRSAGTYRRKGR